MDFLTHTFMGVGAARLMVNDRRVMPQVGLAAMLGSLLQDGDSWLYLISANHYGLYHRVVSHSFVGLLVVGVVAAGATWVVTRRWRRFGWFVTDNVPASEEQPGHAPFYLFVAAAVCGAYLHWCADVVTGFGNVTPFWPWSKWDASVAVISSFDVFVFSGTLAWFLALRYFDLPRRKEVWVTAGYVVLLLGYVGWRWASGAHAII